jgi:NAD(P)H dehydrogenase (quinone)
MSQTTVAIVYTSSYGHTKTVAEHLAKGVAETGATADLIEISAKQIGPDGRWSDADVMERLARADAIVFGSPTYMGSASGLLKLFLERAFDPWWVQAWKDKIAAGFTNSASRSGDKLATLLQLSIFAAQMGMIWVGVGDPPGGNRANSTADDVNHLGSWLGLMTQSPAGADSAVAPSAGDRHSAERFGRRIARTTQRWMAAHEAYPPKRISEDEGARRDQAGLSEWRKFAD